MTKRSGDQPTSPAKRAKISGAGSNKCSQRHELHDVDPEKASAPAPRQSLDAATATADASFEDEDAPADEALPSDALVAINYLRAQFPKDAGVAPFCLKTQLYCVLTDRTITDRELDELRHANAVRYFKLPAGSDECAIMLTSDYAAAGEACRPAAAAAGTPPPLLRTFAWFCERVLPRCTDPAIPHERLIELLSSDPSGGAQRERANERHLGLLLQHCCLTRQVPTGAGRGAVGGYVFCMPGAGAAVKGVDAGRREILAALRRRKYPEMLEAELEKRKLRQSPLGMRWHVRDMLGGGALVRTSTTVGALIRVAHRT